MKEFTTRSFLGFGEGKQLGECFYSRGFAPSLNGVSPRWNITSTQNSSNLTNLGNIVGYAQGDIVGTGIRVVAADSNNNIFMKDSGDWSLAYNVGETNLRAITFDRDYQLLYLTDEYVGAYSGLANYTTGTVAVTNGGTTVTGTGTTFTAGMVNKRFKIDGENTWYTVSAYTNATTITLSTPYTGTTGSGKNYTIYTAWNDRAYAAAGTPNSSGPGALTLHEDVVLIGNGPTILRKNADDSIGDVLNFPAEMIIQAVSSNKNGILIGLNGESSFTYALVLWDNLATRSITPWIWLPYEIQAIVPYGHNWLVITKREVYITNGYSIEHFAYPPDIGLNRYSLKVKPKGASILGDWLLISVNDSTGALTRFRPGLLALNLKTKLWSSAPFDGKESKATGGAIFTDTLTNTTHIGFYQDLDKTYIGKIEESLPSTASIITAPLGDGNREKVAKAVRLELGFDSEAYQTEDVTSATIEVKLYNQKRPIWGYAVTNAQLSDPTKLQVNGSTYKFAKVGDEVTIAGRTNTGEVRHITAISGAGTTAETWTLDSALPQNCLTSTPLLLTSFVKIGSATLTAQELKDEYLHIPVKNGIKGRKFLAKIYLKGMTGAPIELRSVTLVYDDK